MNPAFVNKVSSVIDRSNDVIGRSIAWLTVIMVLTQFAVVVLRYLFNVGWIAMQESIIYMHAFVFLIGAAYTLHHDAHVRVDIFYHRMSDRGKARVDLLGSIFLLLPVCIFIFMMSWDYVVQSWSLLEGSREAGGLPGVFLLKTSMLLMPVLLGLQGIAMILKSLVIISGEPTTGKGS